MSAALQEKNSFDPNDQEYNSDVAVLANELQQNRKATTARERVFLGVIIVLGVLLYTAQHNVPPVEALVIDSTKKHVEIAQLAELDKSAPLRDLVVSGVLPNVITYMFTYNDHDSYNTGLTTNVDPYVLGGSNANKEMVDYRNLLNPEASGSRVRIDVDPVIQHGDVSDKYIVGWTQTASSNGVVSSVKHITGQIIVGWYPRSATNLVGLYITDFKVLSELPQQVQQR